MTAYRVPTIQQAMVGEGPSQSAVGGCECVRRPCSSSRSPTNWIDGAYSRSRARTVQARSGHSTCRQLSTMQARVESSLSRSTSLVSLSSRYLNHEEKSNGQ